MDCFSSFNLSCLHRTPQGRETAWCRWSCRRLPSSYHSHKASTLGGFTSLLAMNPLDPQVSRCGPHFYGLLAGTRPQSATERSRNRPKGDMAVNLGYAMEADHALGPKVRVHLGICTPSFASHRIFRTKELRVQMQETFTMNIFIYNKCSYQNSQFL